MRLPEDGDIRGPSVNILPMIDVIFAILAFFVMSTLYLTKAEGLPVNLPSAVTATPQDQVDITLTITADGELFLDDQPVASGDLASEVRSRADNNPTLVTIRADEAINLGRVVTAMDQLRQVEGVRLGIATTRQN
jgi:biopolymer transport protein ExbD